MVSLDRTLQRPGASIRYRDGGDGRAVVFLHGAGMDHAMFDVQADALQSAGYRVVLFDLRGHGESTLGAGIRFTASDAVDDLGALLEALELTDSVLVGQSLGGNVAQTFLREHPERVRGLIVVGSTWNTGPLTGVERLWLRMAAPLLALVPARLLPRLMAKASAVDAQAIEEIARVFARMPKKAFLDVWRATASLVEPDPSYRTPAPLGLIRGAEDRTGNIATAMPAWAAAEGVTECVIPDAGHVVTLDAPEASAREILDLLRGFDEQ